MNPSEPRPVRLADAELEATFLPQAGMVCSSLRHRGQELLGQGAGVAAYAREGRTMGIPLLYPWANRLAAFDYSVAGRSVAVPHDPGRVALDDNGLPLHGVIAARLAWELQGTKAAEPASGSVSAGPESVEAGSFEARASWSDSQPDVFEVFPFRHDLQYRASLRDGRLAIEVTVHACGSDVVPVAFGFHPYLTLAGIARERWLVELPAMRHLELDSGQIPVGPGDWLVAQTFELARREFDDGFDSLSEPARFAVTVGGRRIEVEFLQGYPCAQVYAPPQGQFICFEPMTAPANALRSGLGLRLLAPGESYRGAFSVCVRGVPSAG